MKMRIEYSWLSFANHYSDRNNSNEHYSLPILPYVLPLDVLLTSCLVDPVARLDTTKIIIDNPAIDAPNMINVSLVGSTLK